MRPGSLALIVSTLGITKEASGGVTDVFVSYSRRDGEFVRNLHAALTERGKDVWVDWEDIPPSAPWRDQIAHAITAADAFVVVISPDSAVSGEVARELDYAVDQGKRLIPLVRRDIEPSEMPEPLAALNWIYLRETDDFTAAIDALIQAMDVDLEWVRAHTRLQVRAGEWEERERDRSFLLRGSDLTEAEAWLGGQAGKEPSPTPLQTEFVLASRRGATRRLRNSIGAIALGFVVAVAFATLALLQWNEAVRQRTRAQRQANLAKSRELAALAEQQIGIDPVRAVLLAVEGARRAPTTQVAASLRQTLPRAHVRAVLDIENPTAVLRRAAFSPDGSRVVTPFKDAGARVWDAVTGEAVSDLLTDGGSEDDPLSEVADVAFSPDGSLVATAGSVGVRLWDSATGQSGPKLDGGPSRGADVVAFSPDGSVVAAGYGSGSIAVWETNTGNLVSRFVDPGGDIRAIALTGDGTRLLSAPGYFVASAPNILVSGVHGSPRVWDVASGRSVGVLEGVDPDAVVVAIAIPRGGDVVAGVATDGSGYVWDLGSGRVLHPLAGSRRGLLGVDVSPDGRFVVTAGYDGVARVYRLSTGRPVTEYTEHDGQVIDARFSPDSRFVVTASTDGTARVWVAQTGREAAVLRGHTSWVMGAWFSPDGSRVLTASLDGTARIWDPAVREGIVPLKGHLGPVTVAAFSPDGSRIATGEAQEVPRARIWEPYTARQIGRTGPLHEFVSFVEFSPDGRLLLALSGGQLPFAYVWDGRTGRPVSVYKEHSHPLFEPVATATFSPAGGEVLTAGADGTARLWDPETAHTRLVLDDRDEQVAGGPDDPLNHLSSAVFSADASLVVTVGGLSHEVGEADAYGNRDREFFRGTFGVWDARTGQRVATLRDLPFEPKTASFSSDGRLLVTAGSERVVRLWDAATLEPVAALRGHRAKVTIARFSPDGSRLLSASTESPYDPQTLEPLPPDTVIRVWDSTSGRLLRAIDMGAHVNQARFSPDGALIVVATDDGASVWSAVTGRQVANLPGNPEAVNDAAFSPDGRYVLVAGNDGIVRVYSQETFASLQNLLSLAARRVTRELTPEERAIFLHEPIAAAAGSSSVET